MVFFLISYICVIQYDILFFRLSRGKLIDFNLLMHQVKTFFDILVRLIDGFHDLYNDPATTFSQKRIQVSSTQRLLMVFKKQKEKKCKILIFFFVIFSCNISYTQSKQITPSFSSSTRWSSSFSSFSDSFNSGFAPKFSRYRFNTTGCSHYFDNCFQEYPETF